MSKDVARALRESARKELYYANHGDGKGNPISDAVHVSIANALERTAYLMEHPEASP
jgi:hypothetical protein